MKHAAVLFAYAWVGAYFLDEIFTYPATDAMTFTRWLTANPTVILVVAAALLSVRYLLVAALFHWLRGEGRWVSDGLGAWAATLLIDLLFLLFATRFAVPLRLSGFLSINQLFAVAAALLGARLAEEHAWRPPLQEARRWLLDTASWARY